MSIHLTHKQLRALGEAKNQIGDLINIAAGDLKGCTELEQIEMTREALAVAGKEITAYRRRVMKKIHS